jgi:hypothetical protein
MILINKNSANTVVLTLTEKSELTNPFYLFEFTSDLTKDKVYFISEDTSLHKHRYNRFTITETANADNLQGEIELNSEGFWSYKIYESETQTLDPDNLNIVEVGKVKVVGVSTDKPVFEAEEKTLKVYNG